MDILFQVITYPIQRIVALLFSLEIADGISVGALLVAALLLGIIFRALIGMHLSVFSNQRGPTEQEEIDAARHRMYINEKARKS